MREQHVQRSWGRRTHLWFQEVKEPVLLEHRERGGEVGVAG